MRYAVSQAYCKQYTVVTFTEVKINNGDIKVNKSCSVISFNSHFTSSSSMIQSAYFLCDVYIQRLQLAALTACIQLYSVHLVLPLHTQQ